MGAGDPVRIALEAAVVVVDAVDSLGENLFGGEIPLEVLHGETRAEGGDPLANIHAEGNEYHLLGIEQPVILQGLDAAVDHIILMSLVELALELEHEDSASLLSLGQVLVEGGQFLTVLEAVILEVGVVVGLDIHALDVPVVVDHKHEVGGHVHVELTAPEVVLLGELEGLDGVLGVAGLLAVPEAPVGGDGYFG